MLKVTSYQSTFMNSLRVRVHITLGAWIGSQQTAFILMAIGAFFGIWKIATPMKLGITGEKAKELMGSGFVVVAPTIEFLELKKES